ncbi:MAG: hypothetical protein KF689_11825 [Gemmatimonadaceae bacterium]|nr:hypothetical protein [Gemmatimonadaceae bacterium]MCW5827333.1 hypothetical protein [Gemmatimonadaceae bacterium]
MEAKEETLAAKNEVESHFVLGLTEADYRPFEAALGGVPQSVARHFSFFRDAVEAVVETTSTPFTISFDAAQRAAEKHHLLLDAIHSLKDERATPLTPGEAEKAAAARLDRVRSLLREKYSADEGRYEIFREAARPLIFGHRSGTLVKLARELLAQGAVGLWGCFESLAKDVARSVVNESPSLARAVLDDPVASKHFEFPRMSYDDLAKSSFDFSGKVGDVLFGSRDFSDLRRLKAALHALFPDRPELREALGRPELWRLCQDRHLIVHRRGLIDEQYLINTGQELAVGDLLVLTPREFLDRARLVLAAGAALAQASTGRAAS